MINTQGFISVSAQSRQEHLFIFSPVTIKGSLRRKGSRVLVSCLHINNWLSYQRSKTMNRNELSLGIQTALELVLPFLFGFIIALFFLGELNTSIEKVNWFFGTSITALVSLLGLIGLVITFSIQHIREQIRDVQNAVLMYSKDGLCWIFAGFDLDEITRRMDWLFSQAAKTLEEDLKSDKTSEDIEYDQANLDAYHNEKIRFGEMLKTYIDLENERKGMYHMMVSL